MKNIFFGDSITESSGLNPYGAVYPYLYCASRGEAPLVLAVANSCAEDQLLAVLNNPPSAGDKCFIMAGTNNLGGNPGQGRGFAASALSLYSATMLSYAFFLGGITKPATDPAWTYSGTWGTSGIPVLGRYTSDLAATMTIPFSGDVFAMAYLLSDGLTGSAFSITIDGVVHNGFTSVPPTTINTWSFHQTYATALALISGCGPGAHTAVVKLTSAGFLMPVWVWLGPIGVPVYMLTIPPMRSPAVGTAAGISAYNSTLAAVVGQAALVGNQAIMIDTWSAISTIGNDMWPDGVHIQQQGHQKLFGAIKAVAG